MYTAKRWIAPFPAPRSTSSVDDPASGKFTPDGSGAGCGFSCHASVAAKDYIFTAYGPR